MIHLCRKNMGRYAYHLIGLMLALSFCITSMASASGTRDTRFLLPEEVQGSASGTASIYANTISSSPGINGRNAMFLTPEEISGQGGSARTSTQLASSTRRSGDAYIGNCKNWINVRGDASTQNTPVGRINVGEAISVLYWNVAGDWAYVLYQDGASTGWVFGKFIKTN